MNSETEFAKMVAGERYFPPALAELRLRAQTLCAHYNALPPADTAARTALLCDLLGAYAPSAVIEQPFRCDYGCNIRIGAASFLNYNCVMLDCAPITLGNHVLCGPNCSFYTAIHPTDPAERLTDAESAKPITLHDNVWLGGNVTVLPGVTIGKNSVVGAGSVVTKSLPENVVAAGNPARIIRQL